MFQSKSLMAWLGVAVMVCGFQNCGSARSANSSVGTATSTSNQQQVIGQTDEYNKLVYDPLLEASTASVDSRPFVHMEIDIEQGTLQLKTASQSQSCSVDSPRLETLRTILATSQICQPGPAPQGSVQCLAYSYADIELINNSDRVLLRAPLCGEGTFLCDGVDSALRTLLTDLRDHPPASCAQ